MIVSINDTSNYIKYTSNLLISLNNTSNYVIITSNYMLNFINSSKNNKWSSNLYNNMIYYNDYNVGIGTNNPQSKLHLYNDVSNSTSLTIQNLYINTVADFPPIISTLTPETLTTAQYKYIIFKYTTETDANTRQTKYTIDIPKGTVCDILMVGGGGAGGKSIGGGGGGGAVLYGKDISIPEGKYTINVGRGATSGETNGAPTTGFGATIYGGGSGANITYGDGQVKSGNSGGSGAGGKVYSSTTYQNNGNAGGVIDSILGNILINATLYSGKAGGAGGGGTVNRSGGGGGAGAVGITGSASTNPGKGGDGIMVNITGTDLYWGGGGGGANYNNTGSASGGLGGGGAGQRNDNNIITYGTVGGNAYSSATNMNAGQHTGSGGGGAGYGLTLGNNMGGDGGSGIIIIKYINVIPINNSLIELKNFTSKYTITNNNNDFKIASILSQTNDILVIKSTGFVGIGTTTPGYMLEVLDNTALIPVSFSDNGYYFKNNSLLGTTTTSPYTPTSRICAKFNDSILLTEGSFVISSDIRIKEDIQDIEDDSILQKFLGIKPKTYKYIDRIKKGDNKVYGFIAQQVKNIIPEAVNIEKSYIPNIMMEAEYNKKTIVLPYKPTNVTIKIKDKIKCYDSENKLIEIEVYDIIDELSFIIKDLDREYTNNKIFVYGTYIDDFHTLFKDNIFTLNVCATQELYKQLKKQKDIIKLQEERIGRLEIENDELENKFNKLLELIEEMKVK